MNRKELIEKILEAANETYPIMIKMTDYDESIFAVTICAMIDMYAQCNDIDKIKVATRIYEELRR